MRALQVVASAGEVQAGAGAVELVVQDGLQAVLPLKGLFDAEKEVARLERQRGKLQKDLGGLEGRLKNEKFVESAPEKVVAETREQAGALREQLAVLEGKVAQARAML